MSFVSLFMIFYVFYLRLLGRDVFIQTPRVSIAQVSFLASPPGAFLFL